MNRKISFFGLLYFFCFVNRSLGDDNVNITYTKHIAPILYKNCISCHSQGQIGPFSLLTYKDAVRKARTIKRVTESAYMPPWHADTKYSHLANPMKLKPEDIVLIKKWVESGTPLGDTALMPDAKKYLANVSEKPDMVLQLPRMSIKGNNEEKFYYIKIPFQLPRPLKVCKCEFVPGNTKVVHHTDAFLYNMSPNANPFDGPVYADYNSFKTIIEMQDFFKLKNNEGTYLKPTSTTILDFFPGKQSENFPKGIFRDFIMMSRGVILLNSMHYGGSPVDTFDQSKINIYFCREQPKRSVLNFSFGSPDFNITPKLVIPPNTVKSFSTWIRIDKDMSLLSVQPHAHLLCKSIMAYAITPDNKTIPLLKIPDWDFRWQRVYKLKNMVHIPRNTKIYLEGVYDNTVKNPNNPYNPPQVINESFRTKDEMLQLWIEFLPYIKGDEKISLER